MHGKIQRVFMSLMLGGFSCIALAQPSINPSWYVGLDAGAAYSPHHATMTVDNRSEAPPPYHLDQYSTQHQRQAVLGLQVGKRWAQNKAWFPFIALGLRYQHFFERDIKGNVTQYSNPDYTNYAYRWPSSTHVTSVNAKVNIRQFKQFLPYLSGGLGAAFHRTGAYQESPYGNITPRLSPDYASKHHTQFYYDVGLGVDMLMTLQWIISLGYDYQSLGGIQSDFGQNGWEDSRLDLGRFSTHTALISLTYLY